MRRTKVRVAVSKIDASLFSVSVFGNAASHDDNWGTFIAGGT
jgi:hypothetical protein